MTIDEIRVWLNPFESRGSRLGFTDKITIRGEDGKIKGKGIGRNGKKIQKIETEEDGKMRYIIKKMGKNKQIRLFSFLRLFF